MAPPNLWTFIKSSKATQSASLEVLQQFVLSLNRDCLVRMIEVYIQSLISRNQTIHGLTVSQAAHRIVYEDRNDTLSAGDATILNRIQCAYGKRYGKQIVRKLQQNNIENNHLLTINAEVFASTLQFLSFKELAQVQTTCAYFTYITTSYRGLSHNFINLNQRYVFYLLLNS